MNSDEHKHKAEVLAECAAVFEKRLYESTVTKPGGEQRRAAVPLSVINYLDYLQRQAQIHATLALLPDPIVEVNAPLEATFQWEPDANPEAAEQMLLVCPICGHRKAVWSQDPTVYTCDGSSMLIGHPSQEMKPD